MIKSNYCVHDCETGGLSEEENPITEYACIILDGKTLKEVDRWQTFVKPYNDLIITKESLEKTMASMSDIKTGLTSKEFSATAAEFWETHRAKAKYRDAGRLISVGHNVVFDHRFLEYILNLHKKNFYDYFYENFADTQVFSKMAFGIKGDEKLTLTQTTVNAKLKLTDAHGAMNDVEATADFFRWCMKRFRTKGGSGASEKAESRAKGSEFFEFTCK